MLVRAKLSRSQRRQIRYQRNCVALPILANVTSYQVDLLFGKISFQDLCFNFVPEFRRYLTPQCSCLMEKNQCIVFKVFPKGDDFS